MPKISPKTCEVGGVQYESVHVPDDTCKGCAGWYLGPQPTLCTSLPGCKNIIWVRLTPEPDLDQVRTKGSFATSLADAYTLADSANRKTLLATFPKVFQ